MLAAKHAGIRPVWASEIDAFPAAVTAKRFPGVVQLGDIRKLNLDWLPVVDIICAGSPCQDLSIAGNRKGLKGERSGLFSEAIRIVREMRRRYSLPRYFVWENVPGVFSSNGGRDFRAVLQQISQAEIPMPPDNRWANAGVVEWGSSSLAWRTIDAQHWGVPQRRKRLFLVADLTGKSAAQILFERKGLPGNLAESREEGKDIATNAGADAEKPIRDVSTMHDRQCVYSVGSFAKYDETQTAATLKASGGDLGGGSENLVAQNIVHSHTYADVASTLRAGAGAPKHMSDIQGRLVQTNMYKYVGQDKCNIHKYVRKFTPTECERLQGLPDGYTKIIFNGKPASDGHRYKAIGNGMAQPCADYVLRRIAEFSKMVR